MSLVGLIAVALLGGLLAETGRAFASARRGRQLNRALHELRRPLQVLSLSLERGVWDLDAGRACMSQARTALAELDSVVNGRRPAQGPRLGELDEVLEGVRRRWRVAGVEVRGGSTGAAVPDPHLLGVALDNLVANALEHGGFPVSVDASAGRGSAQVVVQDAGRSVGPGRPSERRDPRRGHGLRIVDSYAASGGGSVELRRTPGAGAAATIRIPVSREPADGRGALAERR